MNRTTIINDIVKEMNYKSYLEVGVFDTKRNFDSILCPFKIGVDPAMKSTRDILPVTSDTFFDAYRGRFDIIFIDGLHTYGQTRRDLLNSLNILSDDGCIVMHDCLPKTEKEAAPQKPDDGLAWCGGVFRGYYDACNTEGLDCHCVDIDHGLGLIRRKPSFVFLESTNVSFDKYQEERQNLNIIERWSHEICRNILH